LPEFKGPAAVLPDRATGPLQFTGLKIIVPVFVLPFDILIFVNLLGKKRISWNREENNQKFLTETYMPRSKTP